MYSPREAAACVELRNYPTEAQRHHHDFHQIVLPCCGGLDLDIDGKGGYIKEGRGVLIWAGEAHAFAATAENTFIVMDMPIAMAVGLGIPSQLPGPSYFPIAVGADCLMRHFVYSTKTLGLSADLRLSWATLLLDSIGLVRRDGGSLAQTDRILQNAQKFMRSNFGDPIGVEEIAKATGVSESRLFGVFRQHLKTSPNAVLTRLRLDEAHRLLISTGLSIAEIALRTGHYDQSALTRRMRQVDGVTPAQVRRQSALRNCNVVSE